MADPTLYNERSGVTFKSTDSKNWYVDSDDWAVTIAAADGKIDRVELRADDKILLGTGATRTVLDSGLLRAIATAYGGDCSGSRCAYPCYIKDSSHPDGSPTKHGVKVTLPWSAGGITFEPRAFYRGSYSCRDGTCTCKFGLKTKEGALTYGSAVYKSAYFKWDVKNAEITMF